MSNPIITIAIDGYSSSGKSTMAKVVAKKIGYRFDSSYQKYLKEINWWHHNPDDIKKIFRI